MFIQIHMLQSMPPGNLNRDDAGEPKKCVFGGVTRGRISSQCLKRNIRHSSEFKTAFGDALADRTTYLPEMIAEEIKKDQALGIPDEELESIMLAIAGRFKREKRGSEGEDEEGSVENQESDTGSSAPVNKFRQTPQLVFFPPPFARRIAELIADMRKSNNKVYEYFRTGKHLKPHTDAETEAKGQQDKLQKKASKDKDKENLEKAVAKFVMQVAKASKCLTVDIGLFGRMTTSDLVVDIEATCQVAHAIGTHEVFIESDYFTAMDDKAKGVGAAFLGSGETETFFNSSVYYKYLNLDLDALKKHLTTMDDKDLARVAGVLINAAAYATPTGKQNSFASHSVPEFILVELSKTKRPLSYANAFLQPVEGGVGLNLMSESAKALCKYIDSVATAFMPQDMSRLLLAVGPASVPFLSEHVSLDTIGGLINAVIEKTGSST